MSTESGTTLTIRLPVKQKTEWETAAKEEDRSVASLIRHAMRMYLTETASQKPVPQTDPHLRRSEP